MRLLNEGRYSVLEFLVCSRHATPNFGVLRPQPVNVPQPVEPVNIPQPVEPMNVPQPVELVNFPQSVEPMNVPQPVEPVNPRPPSPILLELPPPQFREEIIARLLPPRIRQPVPPNLFDVSSDSDDEENVIGRPQANQIQNEDFNILENSDSNDEQNVMARSQAIRPHVNWIHREDLNIIPIVEQQCYICLFSPPTVIALPCLHQGLCESCFTSYSIIAPYSRRPYYRCPLCRGQVESYSVIQ
uniref:RING-type domain-containing protein n=1 Tax=Schizaphis graminum TaxID=13262 RepID=A0A2S2NF64_SCHGA